jgi:hypothetical protein
MAACPPKSIYFQEAARPRNRAALFLDTSFWQKKKYLAHLLVNSYKAMQVLVCEKLFFNKMIAGEITNQWAQNKTKKIKNPTFSSAKIRPHLSIWVIKSNE